jgi:prolyl-tRNA editing enzyme YbaK/EbsC (Cys-tRNA(Pro) deacylase)
MIKENDEVVFNAGSLEKSIFMKMEDYFRIANPQVVSIALRG